MSRLWYPPDFADWPPEAREAWYSINADREDMVREFRRAAGIGECDRSVCISSEDCAAAVQKLSDGEHIIGIGNPLQACLSALYDEAGIDGDPEVAWVTKPELDEITRQLRNDEGYLTSPQPVRDGW